MSTLLPAYAVLFVLFLTIGRRCQLRVERDYAAGRLLSVETVSLVWILYVLQIALVAVPAVTGWGRVPGPSLLHRIVGSSLAGLGLGFGLWGVASFRSFRRMNGRDTSELITSGAYRYSRNPQNVGVGVFLVGFALFGLSTMAFAAAALFWVLFRAYVPMEERFLESQYGDRYRAYRASSHRYFGIPGHAAST